MNALSRFLSTVMPFVEEELEKNISSSAFDAFQASWDDDREGVSCLVTVCDQQAKTLFARSASNSGSQRDSASTAASSVSGSGSGEWEEIVTALSGSDVSWNSNGSLLAVAHARPDHAGQVRSGRVGLATLQIVARWGHFVFMLLVLRFGGLRS